MKILAVDTAINSCSVALVGFPEMLSSEKKTSRGTPFAETTIVTRETHSKHLMEMIQTVMKMSGLTVSEVDGFAVAKGPGSFTGLRIGISTVKGLASASGKPFAGISNLDALASQFSFSSYPICVLLDAHKGEVYTSCYRFEHGLLKKETTDQVLSPDQAVSNISEPYLFVGAGAYLYKNVITNKMGEYAHFAPTCFNILRASTVACLAMERFGNNDTDDLATFVPHYIRKSDAELNFGKKSKS
ncbi:tRNA (adenosine(37)-N6)-threonylcarbamoyltransferase complex dimerization subunit type 1 TsaB [Desulfonema magnum]|uniref:N(6)-L-threonylcarbamoyladenine synthase n=1 Tax=Desulfonema magnum TaxID=45655 RepID=A0A975BFS1_9BACT|nr:tRNA (adenosine(37)-N6)-threonylcarbamoyltransferase complex dimerization subunit type 1 TsaB [Desulfonema magnum]QTA84616.1 tRNA threonylcarbamoyladenosine biosynthesis protein [Desulfonema magnum]